MRLKEAFNIQLDRLVRPEIQVLHQSISAFQVCGYTGLVLATLLVITLVTYLGLSLWVMAAIILSAVLTFLGLAMVTKIITDEERLIYYHYEIAVMLVIAALLWLSRQPILAYLDITTLGLGVFLACGRVGCLMVGCCHGVPHSWGVRYWAAHTATGLSPYHIEVRLFPIQAVESLWVLGIVFVGGAFVLSGQAPGQALAWYVVTYSLGRFCFEFMRGDLQRPYYGGLSEAQWTSLLLMCAVVWAELTGTLTFHWWHLGATAFLGVTMIAVASWKRPQGTVKHLLLHPEHMQEIAGAIQLVSNLAVERCDVCKQNFAPSNIHVGCTSLGVQISASKIKGTAGYTYHYALSCQNGIMSEKTARRLAEFILQIKYSSDSGEFIKGNRGVFHLLVHTSATADTLRLKGSGLRNGMAPEYLHIRLPGGYKVGSSAWGRTGEGATSAPENRDKPAELMAVRDWYSNGRGIAQPAPAISFGIPSDDSPTRQFAAPALH